MNCLHLQLVMPWLGVTWQMDLTQSHKHSRQKVQMHSYKAMGGRGGGGAAHVYTAQH